MPAYEEVFGIRIADLDVNGAVDVVLEATRRREGVLSVVCASAHTLTEITHDAELRDIYGNAGLVLPDGIGASAASMLAGGHLWRKVGGPDLCEALSRRAPSGLRYFLFGTTPETLGKMVARFERDFPQIAIVGTLSPPMGPISDEENDRAIEAINQSHADVLWVGMSAPKQEKWIAAHAARLNVPVALAVGAAFDFFCGNKKRPAWATRSGLFWLYRLVTEPRRLGARYLVVLPQFVQLALLNGLRTRLGRLPPL
jgi:N-acetylglucosaminyldiphosphoundecaprenol N-acetyl-beta-D-mannosaminyltransferase